MGLCLPDLDGIVLVLKLQSGERCECAHAAGNDFCALIPVNSTFGFQKLFCIKHAFLGLRSAFEIAGLFKRFDQKLCPDAGKLLCKRQMRIVIGDFRLFHEHHGTGIEPQLHLHERDACFSVACLNRAGNRRCAAPAGQNARVNVDCFDVACFPDAARAVENRFRENKSVCRDNQKIGVDAAKLFMHCCGPFRISFEAQRCGSFHRNA